MLPPNVYAPRTTKQETGIISHGLTVWLFTPLAGDIILILIESMKLKAYYEGFCLYPLLWNPKQAEIYTKKVVPKILEKTDLLKLLIFMVYIFFVLSWELAILRLLKPRSVLNIICYEINVIKTN